mmetsp:Transcript_29489/g.90409  ORF Transcript_29489/g.90409 Transcript_29489/m.90409 type:complete len:81 (-) Transcript_29489:1113-1355(-)
MISLRREVPSKTMLLRVLRSGYREPRKPRGCSAPLNGRGKTADLELSSWRSACLSLSLLHTAGDVVATDTRTERRRNRQV